MPRGKSRREPSSRSTGTQPARSTARCRRSRRCCSRRAWCSPARLFVADIAALSRCTRARWFRDSASGHLARLAVHNGHGPGRGRGPRFRLEVALWCCRYSARPVLHRHRQRVAQEPPGLFRRHSHAVGDPRYRQLDRHQSPGRQADDARGTAIALSALLPFDRDLRIIAMGASPGADGRAALRL